MNPQFWITAWKEGRTGFHRPSYHEKLVTHFPLLKARAGERVLVPLCGKSKDLAWLQKQGLAVHGVELHSQAVEDFFPENGFASPKKSQDVDFTHFSSDGVLLSCGDFFRLGANAAYDLVYDRAALVALPETMRQNYAEVIKRAIKPGGRYLLITYEYDQTKMDGPPFSVTEQEVRSLYQDEFSIRLVENKRPSSDGPRLEAVDGLTQAVTLLEKLRP